MIEFQLTVYMCSYCTRVHNAAQDCVRHELEEHTRNQSFTTTVVDDNIEPTVSTPTIDDFTTIKENYVSNFQSSTDPPFTIANDDIKPGVTINQEDDSDLQRVTSLMLVEEMPAINENESIVVLRRGAKRDASITISNKAKKQESAPLSNKKNNRSHGNHHNQKNTCTICGKIFLKHGQHLKRHMLIHSDERPLKCAKCPWRFCQVCYYN